MTSERPDFEALRQARNEAIREHSFRIAEGLGWDLSSLQVGFDFDSCYCTCGSSEHGPWLCEHDWSGPVVEIDDGLGSSATCARCGCTAISHDMRVMP